MIAKTRGEHLAAIKKNNMKGKNRDLDRWYSGIRSPYERVFSQRERGVRYRGVAKNQFAAFMQATCCIKYYKCLFFLMERCVQIE
jgi:transposase, IS5 family